MSEDLPEAGETNDVRELRARVKEQRAELEAAKAQAAEAEALKRRLMFAEGGVDVTNPKAKYFVAGYDGETDAAAIKAAWNEFAGETPQSAPQQDLTPEVEAMRRISEASAGAPAPGGDDTAAYHAELRAIGDATRDPYKAQEMALEVMRKYGVKTTRDY
jgi:hypothetical protein